MADDTQKIANTEGSDALRVASPSGEQIVSGFSVDTVTGNHSTLALTAQDEISKILEEVKLPERRRAANDSFIQKSPPTTLSAQIATAPVAVRSMSDAVSAITSVRTLKQDVQSAVRDNDISVVRAVAMEETRRHKDDGRREPTPAAVARSKRTMSVLFIASILMLLAVGALASVWATMQQRAPLSLPPTTSIIFAEQTFPLALDNESPQTLKNIIAQARISLGAPLGSIARIVPTVSTTSQSGVLTRPATLHEFLRAIAVDPPDELLRALGDQFFIGVHAVNKNAPVLVIPVVSYDRAFAGMLAWERAMNVDLAPIYTPVPIYKAGVEGLPTERPFEDIVLRNYDVRALKDDAGEIALYYSFPTPNLLIIAESPYTFTEVLSRLQARRQL